MTATEKITKARVNMVISQPFFATLALNMQYKEDKTCDTAWIDGVSIGYNPDYIDSLTIEQVKTLLVHEVMHVAMLHHTRRGQREPGLWNKATDHAINNELDPAQFAPLDNWLCDAQYKGQAAEEVYSKLDSKQKKEQGNGNNPGQQQQPGPGEVRDFPGNAAEQQQAEAKAKVQVQQALNVAKAAGKMPGDLARSIEAGQPAVVDWRDVLQRFVNENDRSDYTFKKTNTRYLSTGFYLPTLHSQKLPPIVVAIDTSGSVTEQQLADFQEEIESIMEMYQTTINVLYCDRRLHTPQTFEPGDSIELKPGGGGGTSFAPVMDWLNNSEDDHTCCIYFTDMCCYEFGKEPPCPVLWIATERNPYTRQELPFGELVTMY